MSVGFDVANYILPNGKQPFVDFTREEAKELYANIIEVIQEPRWTMAQVQEVVYNICAKYKDAKRSELDTYFKVERIARTELSRILFYAKEQMALEDGQTDSYFVWDGPLDRRTTPLCRYMQTGELTGENKDGSTYDYEYLRPELPQWDSEGKTLPELKQMCRDVHTVFYTHHLIGTPMITDWQMHINCRHSFRRTNRTVPKEEAPTEVDGWIQLDNVPESPVEPEKPPTLVGVPESIYVPPEPQETPVYEPLHVDVVGDAVAVADDVDDLEVFENQYARYTFGFERSFKGIPLFILPTSEENDESAIFQFSTLDEYRLGNWLRFIVEEMDAGMSLDNIVAVLNSETNLTYQEIGYIQKNWDWLFDVAYDMGWIL